MVSGGAPCLRPRMANVSQTVIAGHVGKGRMVNDEGAGTVGEYRLQCVVERIHAVRETFVVLSVAGRVGVHAFELGSGGSLP